MKQPYIWFVSFVITVEFWWQKMGKPQRPAPSCCTEPWGPRLWLSVDEMQSGQIMNFSSLPTTARTASRGEVAHQFYSSWPNNHSSIQLPAQNGKLGSSHGNSAKDEPAWACAIFRYCSSLQDWSARAIRRNVQRLSCNEGGVGVCCVRHERASLQHITLCHFLLGPPLSSPSLGLYIEPHIKNALLLPPSLFNHPVKEPELSLSACNVTLPSLQRLPNFLEES